MTCYPVLIYTSPNRLGHFFLSIWLLKCLMTGSGEMCFISVSVSPQTVFRYVIKEGSYALFLIHYVSVLVIVYLYPMWNFPL